MKICKFLFTVSMVSMSQLIYHLFKSIKPNIDCDIKKLKTTLMVDKIKHIVTLTCRNCHTKERYYMFVMLTWQP